MCGPLALWSIPCFRKVTPDQHACFVHPCLELNEVSTLESLAFAHVGRHASWRMHNM